MLPPETLAILGLVAVVAGFLDAIAGGGGLIAVPALAMAGLDPVAVVATNKLGGTFGAGSATFAFARAGMIDFSATWPTALGAGIGAILGALLLPFAPRDAATAALPFILIGVALYFAVSPQFGDSDRRPRVSDRTYAWSWAPLIGFYDGVFGPGAGSFYLIGLVVLVGLGAKKAVANARFANFASNVGSLAIFAAGGHIVVAAGLAMGAGQFIGSRFGARAVIGGGVRLVRPLIVVASCAMALRLLLRPDNAARDWLFRMISAVTGN
jgi:uncharacterized membrane protein YfcA